MTECCGWIGKIFGHKFCKAYPIDELGWDSQSVTIDELERILKLREPKIYCKRCGKYRDNL